MVYEMWAYENLSCFTHFSVHLVISIQTLKNEDRTRNNDYEQDHLRKGAGLTEKYLLRNTEGKIHECSFD